MSSRRRAFVVALCALVMSLAAAPAALANPNIGYSRWCADNGFPCYAWPGINQGWGAFGFAADFYYTHAADNYGQALACWITPINTNYWEWFSVTYGHCAISSGSRAGASNVTGIWLETLPAQGDGIGAGSSWY